MNKLQISGRINWLSLTLVARRNNIAALLSRLVGIGTRIGASLGLQKKFIRLLEQVAVEREKELDLLHKIESMEKRHESLRRHGQLRMATSPRMQTFAPSSDETPEPPPSQINLWKLFGLIYLLSHAGGKHKNQELTVD